MHAIPEFRVTPDLILHARRDIILFVAAYAFRPKLGAKLAEQFRVSGQISRLQHRGLRQRVFVCLKERFSYRTGRMANLEPDIPKQIENLFHRLGDKRRNFVSALRMQKHQINVAERIQFAAPIAAQCDHCHGRWRSVLLAFGRRAGTGENLPQQNIHHLNPKRANVAASASSLVSQAQPVILDFEKLLVDWQKVRWTLGAGRFELAFGVRQHFVQMTRHRRRKRSAETLSPQRRLHSDQRFEFKARSHNA